MAPTPKVLACLIADAVRSETNGKLTLLGFCGITPNVTLGIKDINSPVQVAFIFSLERGNGRFALSCEISHERTSQVIVHTDPQSIAITPKDAPYLVFQYVVMIPATGTYRIRLLDGTRPHYTTTFEILHGLP